MTARQLGQRATIVFVPVLTSTPAGAYSHATSTEVLTGHAICHQADTEGFLKYTALSTNTYNSQLQGHCPLQKVMSDKLS